MSYAYTDTPRVRRELARAVSEGLSSSLVGLLHTMMVDSKWLKPDGTVSRPCARRELEMEVSPQVAAKQRRGRLQPVRVEGPPSNVIAFPAR